MRAVAVAVVAAVAACGPVPPPAHPAATDALASRDAKRIRALFHDWVRDQGVWFADPACEAAFPTAAVIRGPKLDAFAVCLAALDLRPSDRTSQNEDFVTYAYAPGFELEAEVLDGRDGPWLVSVGYVGRRDLADGLPTVTPAALEQLRIAGDPAPPAGRVRALDPTTAPFAWLKLCIAADGRVTRAEERDASTPAAARLYTELASTWRFRPFVAGGHTVPVCAMELFHAPAAEPAEYPLPTPTLDKPDVIVLHRLGERRGETQIRPQGDDLRTIVNSGLASIRSTFQYCIDTTGAVDDVRVLRSTGAAHYDQELIAGIRRWTFPPYLDDGKPIPACAVVAYRYSL